MAEIFGVYGLGQVHTHRSNLGCARATGVLTCFNLSQHRSLSEFEEYCGVNFRLRTISPKALSGTLNLTPDLELVLCTLSRRRSSGDVQATRGKGPLQNAPRGGLKPFPCWDLDLD